MKKCGCVFSEQGLKELKENICFSCGKEYSEEEIITINPKPEELKKNPDHLLLKDSSVSKRKSIEELNSETKLKPSSHYSEALDVSKKALISQAADQKLQDIKKLSSISSIYARPTDESLKKSALFQGTFRR